MAMLQNIYLIYGRRGSLCARLGLKGSFGTGFTRKKVFLNEDGLIDKISIRDRLDAHLLVEDFMIATNVAAAQVLEQKNSPVVYRVHNL